MAERCGIMVVTPEADTAARVASALRDSDRLAAEGVLKDLESLAEALRQKPIPAVLVDISHRPHDVLAQLGPLIARHADTRFLVISDVMTNDLILESMKAGARYFMPKASVATASTWALIFRACGTSSRAASPARSSTSCNRTTS